MDSRANTFAKPPLPGMSEAQGSEKRRSQHASRVRQTVAEQAARDEFFLSVIFVHGGATT